MFPTLRLGLSAKKCLVFEDSLAGLQAARAARMWSVTILHSAPHAEEARQLAHLSIQDFRSLSPGCLEDVRGGP
jgi:beta-phosphoglucomutase-like phosphatase (HAD superfamily)